MSVIKLRRPINTAHQQSDYVAYNEHKAETFRTKIAVQQFMNHNGPLFKAFAISGTPVDDLYEGKVLRDPAEKAMRLAVLIAAEVNKKNADDITASEARPFRVEAAEYVATRWLSKRSIDVDKAAVEIASAVSLADVSWDHDVYRDDKLSDDASLMISAVAIAGSLSRLVDIYDFREGRQAALGKIVKAVVETASRIAQEMLPGQVSDADKRNLTQTLARNLSSLMEACYERKAREVVLHLEEHLKNDDQKVAWLNANKPIDSILSSFDEWTICFGAFALAASKGMKTSNVDLTENNKTP